MSEDSFFTAMPREAYALQAAESIVNADKYNSRLTLASVEKEAKDMVAIVKMCMQIIKESSQRPTRE